MRSRFSVASCLNSCLTSIATARLIAAAFLSLLLAGSSALLAQTVNETTWSGIWNAEGTLFSLRITRIDDHLLIEPLETLGFVWSNSLGRISSGPEGESATVEVDYQGVKGTLLVELGESGTAMVRPVDCQPDFHVVCALVQNQQARFVRIEGAGPTSAQR